MSTESSTVSPLFPERPIRPLPKRRLRERLSPDVADSIKYPPAPQTISPLFYYPYSLKEEPAVSAGEHGSFAARENIAEPRQDGISRRNGGAGPEQQESGLMAQARRALVSRPLHEAPGHAVRTPQKPNQARQSNPQPPPSTTSSADGYDSFENTNNKKKRKIPTAGESMLNGTHVLSDSNALGIPSPPATGDEGAGDIAAATPTPYYQSPSSAAASQGISGPGRGRYGRVRNGRSPLRALSDPNSGWNGRTSKMRPGGGQYPPSPAGENSGIISSAIASAEKLPVAPGQENISLLHQQASVKTSPASSQFTFTFDSQVPGSVAWPGSNPTAASMAGLAGHGQPLPGSTDFREPYNTASSRAVQTGHPAASGSAGLNNESNAPDMSAKGNTPGASQKKSKRRSGNSLVQQAKQRRQQAEYQNYHHPPTPEDIWICEFCEYERIFGHAPEALIRQYEIKDRRRRREEAERRRLLEKAKMKSRKGKKASRIPAKNTGATQDRNSHPPAGQHAPPLNNDHSPGSQSEDYEEEEYYEEDVPEEEIPNLVPATDAPPRAPTSVQPTGGVGGGSGGGGHGTGTAGGGTAHLSNPVSV